MWDYPGARLNRQALLELMHLEAEGELVKHFEWWTISLEAAIPRFWAQLNDLTQAYFRQNSETFPDVSSWINWSSHLNAHDRMRFALHSLAIMRPLIGQPPSPLRLLLSFDNSPNSDQHQQQRMDSVEDPCQAGISCRPTRHYQRRRGCPGETCCEAPEVAMATSLPQTATGLSTYNTLWSGSEFCGRFGPFHRNQSFPSPKNPPRK